MDYFNREYLFWMWLHLKVDISSFRYIYLSCLWGKYSLILRLFYLRVCEERWQRPRRQRTHPVYFIFYESTLICCYYDYTQIKVDPLQFQMIPYSYLYDQNWWSIFSSFRGHKENMRQTTPSTGFDPRGLMCRDRLYCLSSNGTRELIVFFNICLKHEINMNEHQNVFYFNLGKTWIHNIFQVLSPPKLIYCPVWFKKKKIVCLSAWRKKNAFKTCSYFRFSERI